jgi:hypothetical protein
MRLAVPASAGRSREWRRLPQLVGSPLISQPACARQVPRVVIVNANG